MVSLPGVTVSCLTSVEGVAVAEAAAVVLAGAVAAVVLDEQAASPSVSARAAVRAKTRENFLV